MTTFRQALCEVLMATMEKSRFNDAMQQHHDEENGEKAIDEVCPAFCAVARFKDNRDSRRCTTLR